MKDKYEIIFKKNLIPAGSVEHAFVLLKNCFSALIFLLLMLMLMLMLEITGVIE